MIIAMILFAKKVHMITDTNYYCQWHPFGFSIFTLWRAKLSIFHRTLASIDRARHSPKIVAPTMNENVP